MHTPVAPRTAARAARALALILCTALMAGCTFHSTASRWNERVGPDGEPVFYQTVTKVGFNLFIILPFIGYTDIDTMVGELTSDIAAKDGDIVRIVQGDSENYWYGWSPFTWIVTPVVTTLAADYRPSQKEWDEETAKDREEDGGIGVLGM